MGNTDSTQSEDGRDENNDYLFYLDLMSHDILNFNQAVLSHLEIALNDTLTNEETRRSLLSAIDQIRNSSQLIDDVKKMARLEQVSSDAFDTLSLDEVVQESIKDLGLMHPERQITVNFRNDAGHVNVKGTDVLGDIFLNLLVNAVRQDQSEKPIVEVTVARPMTPSGMVDVTVEDRGSGIPDQMKSVLAGEKRADNATRKQTGLGLFVVRAAAKRFGGHLIIGDRVHGDHTKGAKLTVRLPEVRS
ncbi:MAG TPA: HAMP domain-containing sensor histidine kinase [Thermoplasmata archaeon]|nr:HAMP domain-containing sensor histidine kinase [Thermoplasmata archaeon]